jgi:hypothetical protein
MMQGLAAVAVLIGAAAALDIVLRVLGFGSFPLFETGVRGVYRTRPNQTGRFRRRHAWRYDANGMRHDAAPASFAETTLLAGDSIVDGGLGLDQGQTLAAIAARHGGGRFYPVACPGWALGNILGALTALPGWSAAKRLVFVLNTGDFDSIVTPDSELGFPTRAPLWLTAWLVTRQVVRRLETVRHPRLKHGIVQPLAELDHEVRESNIARFQELLAEYPGPVVLVRYPMRGEDASSEPYFEQLAALNPRVRILDAAEAEGWSTECYSDHIHPTARGLEVLARHLCRHLD